MVEGEYNYTIREGDYLRSFFLVKIIVTMATILMQGLFQGGGGAGGAFASPMKVFAPPQELVELTY